MMSKIKFRIGPAARSCLRKTSPYTTLLLDISCGMTEQDVSQFKLVIQAEKLGTKRQVGGLKHAADVLAFLDQHGFISKDCTHFLEHLLQKIGRKDLGKLVDEYHAERKDKNVTGDLVESTAQKEVYQPYTKLRELKSEPKQEQPITCQLMQQTAVKELYWHCQRSNPDGASCSSDVLTDDCSQHRGSCDRTGSPLTDDCSQHRGSCDRSGSPLTDDCSQHRGSCDRSGSPMAVDNSQDSLQSSISDEEKLEFLTGKVYKLETCDLSDIIMSSQ